MKRKFSAHILAVNNSGNVLLVRRRDVPIWVIPGGGSDEGEQPKETAIREFFEETGLNVSASDVSLSVHYLPENEKKRHKYTFVATVPDTSRPVVTDESSDVGFFDPNHLPEPISVYEAGRISDALGEMKSDDVLTKIDQVNYWSECVKLSRNPAMLVTLFVKYCLAKMT